jgi:hypothetical protein
MPIRTVTAHLDHVMVVLDSPAHRAVVDSTLAGRFGRFSVKHAHSSLSGRYSSATLVGHSTMVELFDVTTPPVPGMTGGLVLSFEQPGSWRTACELLDAADVPYSHELVRRAEPGEAEMRPWYNLIRPDLGPASPFLLLISEVTEDYYAFMGAERGPGGTVTRQGYLDARLSAGPAADQSMGDITEVTLRLHPEREKRLVSALTKIGYVANGQTLSGPGITFTTEHGEPEGVVSVRMSAATNDIGEESFGDSSVLTVRSDHAEWRFTPTASDVKDGGLA